MSDRHILKLFGAPLPEIPAGFDKRFSRGLSFITFYTYSKVIDSSSSNNLLSRNLDRAESGSNRTHQYTGSMNYDLPFGKGRKWLNRGGVINAIFGEGVTPPGRSTGRAHR